MIDYKPVIQNLSTINGVLVDVLRLDLLHPEISGNKWFKLKYNIEAAIKNNHKGILTFGGAHSNHIAATAAACKLSGLSSKAFIRGELSAELTPTLIFARSQGMEFEFLSRENYAFRNSKEGIQLLKLQQPDFWIVPEGGANKEGILGCTEILTSEMDHDFVFCACGTAATYTGLVMAAKDKQVIVGINILKGNNELVNNVNENLKELGYEASVTGKGELEMGRHFMTDRFAFKGYATFNQELVQFKKQFEAQFPIPLDHVYTVKVFFGAQNMFTQEKMQPGSRVLIVHTGGLQGNAGFEERYAKQLELSGSADHDEV